MLLGLMKGDKVCRTLSCSDPNCCYASLSISFRSDLALRDKEMPMCSAVVERLCPDTPRNTLKV